MNPFKTHTTRFSLKKPQFRTKLKKRNNSSYAGHQDLSWRQTCSFNKTSNNNFQDDAIKKQSNNLSITYNHKFHNPEQQKRFNQTKNQLFNTNFSHHDPSICVCQNCQCGRHLCKLNVVGPDISKSSIYRQDFFKKEVIPNIINNDKQYPKLYGDHLDINSIQRHDYLGKKGDDIQKPIPEDLLKCHGHCPQLTSYSSGFPGYKGQNQYIKPKNRFFRDNFPLNNQTSYGTSFSLGGGKKADLAKTPDNLQIGLKWLGQSNYSNSFQSPQLHNYPKHQKIIEKLEIDPHFKHQYQSIYRNDFVDKGKNICESKRILETKIKGLLSNKKRMFQEKMDYKALSPDYHALSLSGHKFV